VTVDPTNAALAARKASIDNARSKVRPESLVWGGTPLPLVPLVACQPPAARSACISG
jgi:hypothetical protein